MKNRGIVLADIIRTTERIAKSLQVDCQFNEYPADRTFCRFVMRESLLTGMLVAAKEILDNYDRADLRAKVKRLRRESRAKP
jgi:hypothetical protein